MRNSLSPGILTKLIIIAVVAGISIGLASIGPQDTDHEPSARSNPEGITPVASPEANKPKKFSTLKPYPEDEHIPAAGSATKTASVRKTENVQNLN